MNLGEGENIKVIVMLERFPMADDASTLHFFARIALVLLSVRSYTAKALKRYCEGLQPVFSLLSDP